ncbi:MAG: SPOR domain-containing protein [Ignavibacteriales bacterium]|nr:SPOR domain-containing protein [Ignavibacteriales bacterium]
MPLNIENKQYVSADEESAPQPFLHQPKKQYHPIKYILLGGFIIAVTSSAVFLLYLFYLNLYQPSATVETVVLTPDNEQGETTVRQKPSDESAVTKEPLSVDLSKTVPQPSIAADSRYTVYIAVYSSEKSATEEVVRWNEAGFVAAVVNVKNNFRVSIGRFKSTAEANNFAGQWSDAFEYGYWIGTID